MKFSIDENIITIKGIFKTHKIQMKDIGKVDKTPTPFGIRLFGASFLGGLYHLPGVGRTWVAMSNFEDGVLLTTKSGKNFFITPERPFDFIGTLKKRMSRPEI